MNPSNQLERKIIPTLIAFVVIIMLLVLLGIQTQVDAGNTKPTKTPTATFVPPSATPPAGPTPGPCTTCNGSLPKHVLTGYWQDFDNGAKDLRLQDVPTSYGLIAVAFASPGSSAGSVTFSLDAKLSTALGGYTITNFTSDIQSLHAQGRKVILSVGGATGSITISSAAAATNFANSAYALMTQYGFDGVDIDLENGINVTYLTSALQQLSSLAGPGLIITLAPQTLDVQPGGAYLQLAVNINTRQSIATFLMMMEIENIAQLSRVLAKIEQLPNVVEARRRTSI